MSATILKFRRRKRSKSDPNRELREIERRCSFIVDKKPKGAGRHYWAVTPSGNYGDDCQEGRRLAKLFLPMLRYYGGQATLVWIVLDMMKAEGNHDGLTVGFMGEIAAAAWLGTLTREWLEKENRPPDGAA